MVLVFSAMKPKDAAARLTVLDDAVRLPIAAKMKERTLAAILAQMDPSVAKKMTESLATRFAASTSLAAARTAIAYARDRDEMYVFQGGSYTPDQIQDLFRGLGSDTAVLLDGGGSSSIVLRRDTGGLWAGAGSPRGSCDTMAVLCDARERALPSWLAFN